MNSEREKEMSRFFVLLVDEDGEQIDLFRSQFREKFPLITAASAAEAKTILSTREVAIALVEQSIAGQGGLELLEEATRLRPGIVGILMSKSLTGEFMVEAVNRECVWRFVSKPWDHDEMKTTLEMALRRYKDSLREKKLFETLQEIPDYYRSEIVETRGFDMVVGETGDLAGVMDKIHNVSGASTPVLLRGERGTGKELLARTMHRLSIRAKAPFVGLDASAFPKIALEVELFGREAEPGGGPSKKGRIELAEGGTMFIENIESLPPEAQFRLADLLRSGEIERVGGGHRRKVNVAVIGTFTGRMESLAAGRAFRSDLLEMMSAFVINVPPLRSRRQDIPEVAEFFANRAARNAGLESVKIENSAMEKIRSYDWPGNLPELRDVIELAVMHCREGVIHLHDLPGMLGAPAQAAAQGVKQKVEKHKRGAEKEIGLKDRLEDIERAEIIEALKKTGGNKALAARSLGINRATLYYRMKKHGIGD